MEKEHQRREELKNLNEEQKKVKEEEYERMKKRHQDHPKVHHPVRLQGLEAWFSFDSVFLDVRAYIY